MALKMDPIPSFCRTQAAGEAIGNAYPTYIMSIYERVSAKKWNQKVNSWQGALSSILYSQ